METIKTFKQSKKMVNQQFTIAIIMLIIGGVALMAFGIGLIICLGILNLIMAFTNQNRDVVKVYEHNIEAKLAPLGGTKYVKFCDIKDVEVVNDKNSVVHYNEGTSAKKLKLNKALFDDQDYTDLLMMLKNKKVA